MKPQIKPTAMPCTEEQWLNEMKPLCDKHGLKYKNIFNFKDYTHLVNIESNSHQNITNYSDPNSNISRTLIPYHPELFLYNSGIFPEKWAVRGSKEFRGFAEKMGWDLSAVDGKYKHHFYYLDSENEIHADYNQETMPSADYVEVTLEDLIAHYEPKTNDMKKVKFVKCTNKIGLDITYGNITIGKEYEIIRESNDSFAWIIVDDRGKEKSYHKDFFEPTEQPKWEDRTSTGTLIEELIEFNGFYISKFSGVSTPCIYNANGSSYYVDYGNLIPFNPLKAQLLAKKAELQKRIEEIDEKLKK